MKSKPFARLPAAAAVASYRRSMRGSVLLWVLGTMAAGVVLVAVIVVNALTLDREARALRTSMIDALDMRASTRIQVSVGPLLLGGVRTIVSCIDRVPPEARLALRAVRSASVGIYTLHDDSAARSYARLFSPADAAMARRGWSRVAGVIDRRDCVLVYTPTRSGDDDRPVHVCVAVCNARELVVASATISPDGLAELVARQRGSVRF